MMKMALSTARDQHPLWRKKPVRGSECQRTSWTQLQKESRGAGIWTPLGLGVRASGEEACVASWKPWSMWDFSIRAIEFPESSQAGKGSNTYTTYSMWEGSSC